MVFHSSVISCNVKCYVPVIKTSLADPSNNRAAQQDIHSPGVTVYKASIELDMLSFLDGTVIAGPRAEAVWFEFHLSGFLPENLPHVTFKWIQVSY